MGNERICTKEGTNMYESGISVQRSGKKLPGAAVYGLEEPPIASCEGSLAKRGHACCFSSLFYLLAGEKQQLFGFPLAEGAQAELKWTETTASVIKLEYFRITISNERIILFHITRKLQVPWSDQGVQFAKRSSPKILKMRLCKILNIRVTCAKWKPFAAKRTKLSLAKVIVVPKEFVTNELKQIMCSFPRCQVQLIGWHDVFVYWRYEAASAEIW